MFSASTAVTAPPALALARQGSLRAAPPRQNRDLCRRTRVHANACAEEGGREEGREGERTDIAGAGRDAGHKMALLSGGFRLRLSVFCLSRPHPHPC